MVTNSGWTLGRWLSWAGMAALALVVGLYALGFFLIDVLNPDFKAKFAHFPGFAMLHIIPGGTVLILGALQFNGWLRTTKPVLHRRIGLIYVALVVASGTGGLLIAPHATGGVVNALGFGSLAVVWLYSVSRAYLCARARDFVNHQRWMIRNYALTLGAVTLRIYLGVLPAVFGLDFDTAYAIVAWFAWVPNLVVAEWFIVERIARRPVQSPVAA